MKIIVVILIILFALPSFASEIYFGKYFDQHYRSRPGGGKAQYVSGVMLDKKIKFLTPHLQLETLMDGYNGNGSFHPSSIKYDLGIRADIYKGAYLDVSRMCWHNIDAGGSVEEYWLVKVGYRW